MIREFQIADRWCAHNPGFPIRNRSAARLQSRCTPLAARSRFFWACRARAESPFVSEMILTPVPRDRLGLALDRFIAGIGDPYARGVFRRIRATSPNRAAGAEAERHRQVAHSIARAFGMAIHPDGRSGPHNWDGMALNGATEAYVTLHEIAHFVLAPPERRRLVDFGLGPGPDTLDRDAALRAAILPPLAREEDEAAASLLGIVWEAQLGQPALASFLDQNWLEGLDRSAAFHFTAVLGSLRGRGLLGLPVPWRSDRA